MTCDSSSDCIIEHYDLKYRYQVTTLSQLFLLFLVFSWKKGFVDLFTIEVPCSFLSHLWLVSSSPFHYFSLLPQILSSSEPYNRIFPWQTRPLILHFIFNFWGQLLFREWCTSFLSIQFLCNDSQNSAQNRHATWPLSSPKNHIFSVHF